MNAADDAQLQKRIQRSVHGRPRKLRKAILHRLEDLVRRGMIVPLQNGFQDHPPLRGDRKPLLAAYLLELLKSFLDLVNMHMNARW